MLYFDSLELSWCDRFWCTNGDYIERRLAVALSACVSAVEHSDWLLVEMRGCEQPRGATTAAELQIACPSPGSAVEYTAPTTAAVPLPASAAAVAAAVTACSQLLNRSRLHRGTVPSPSAIVSDVGLPGL